MMSQLKNIRTGQILSRLYHDEELGQTWNETGSQQEEPRKIKQKLASGFGGLNRQDPSRYARSLNMKETIAVRRKPRNIKKPQRLNL